jgi:hypothetical protein
MSSLYKRASPSQKRILRAVEGAVKDAAHAHSNAIIPNSFARSVAKRAAGTLTAQWPEVLAAGFNQPSDRVGAGNSWTAQPRSAQSNQRVGRGSSYLQRRSPLPMLWKALSARIRPLRDCGQSEKAEALVDVLKMIAGMQRSTRRMIEDALRAAATPASSGRDTATIEACKAAICSGCASGVEINKAGFHQHNGLTFPCHATALAAPADWQQDKAETSVLPRAIMTEER